MVVRILRKFRRIKYFETISRQNIMFLGSDWTYVFRTTRSPSLFMFCSFAGTSFKGIFFWKVLISNFKKKYFDRISNDSRIEKRADISSNFENRIVTFFDPTIVADFILPMWFVFMWSAVNTIIWTKIKWTYNL